LLRFRVREKSLTEEELERLNTEEHSDGDPYWKDTDNLEELKL
jgi:hypothetical protein